MHELDPDEAMVDSVSPETPELSEVVYVRRPVTSSGCGGAVSSCDGSGEVGIQLLPTADDRSQPDEIGYILELAGGTLPANMSLPVEPVRTDGSGTIWLLFSDDAQSFDFQLSIRAIDLAGNESAAIDIDVVSQESAGCSTVPGRGQRTTWVLLIAALLLGSRARRQRCRGGIMTRRSPT